MKAVRITPNRASWWNLDSNLKIKKLAYGDIATCDALEFLEGLKPESADIVFLDPPFNLGKAYGQNGVKGDRLSDSDYYSFIKKVIEKSSGILKPGGALYLYHIPRWAIRFAPVLQQNLMFRHWIAISMKNGFPRMNFLYPAHYALLYFTKGEPYSFARPKINVPRCRKCNEFIKDYGGYVEFVKDGINLSDVWDDLSPVRHRKFKHRTANELSIEIPKRVLQISGVKSGLMVDPFGGSGSSLIAAQLYGMFFAACDREKDNVALMEKRVSAAAKEILRKKRLKHA